MPPTFILSAFLSTLSLRRATGRHQKQDGIFGISIHALLAESDLLPARRGRGPGISIHALLAESDALAMAGYTKAEIISIHALLAESDGLSGYPPSQ